MNKKIVAVLVFLGLLFVGGCDKKDNQEMDSADEKKGSLSKENSSEEEKDSTANEMMEKETEEGEIIELGNEGELKLKLNDNWKMRQDSTAPEEPMTFIIYHENNPKFEILLSVLRKTEESGLVDARQILNDEWEAIKASAVEKEIVIKDINKGEFEGSYILPITDKNSQNVGDDYKYMSKAIVHNEKAMLLFSYLIREKDDETFSEWLNLINNLEYSEEITGESMDENKIISPSKDVEVIINSETFKQEGIENKKNSSYLLGGDGELVISVDIYKSLSDVDNKEQCRDNTLGNMEKNNPGIEISKSDIKNFAAFEYMLGEVEGLELDQKNLYAFEYKNSYCINIHLSKVMFKESERDMFVNYLDKIEIK